MATKTKWILNNLTILLSLSTSHLTAFPFSMTAVKLPHTPQRSVAPSSSTLPSPGTDDPKNPLKNVSYYLHFSFLAPHTLKITY